MRQSGELSFYENLSERAVANVKKKLLVTKKDGSLLGVEEIWGDVPQACKAHFSNAHISQGEHPVLGLPFYFIHPCNTRHLMALLVDAQPSDTSNAAFLINWLSWVSPIFGIPISILT